jgi:hypothetical protein
MNAITYARKGLDQSFALLNMVADGMTDEQYNWKPEGTANSIAKSHVHGLTSVEFFICATLKCGGMEWPAFAAEHGLPANPTEIWGHTGPISLAAMKDYQAKVQRTVTEYVSSLSEEDLDRQVDTAFFGKKDAAFLLSLASIHLMGHAGDMAAIKGVQGLKGLPF